MQRDTIVVWHAVEAIRRNRSKRLQPRAPGSLSIDQLNEVNGFAGVLADWLMSRPGWSGSVSADGP